MSEQYADPATVGKAEAFRIFPVYDRIGVSAAPENYEWVSLSGGSDMFGQTARALACMKCGGLVAIHEVHTLWHKSHRVEHPPAPR